MPRHAKPKPEKKKKNDESESWLKWLRRLREDRETEEEPPDHPIIDAEHCIICTTYKERGIKPPQGHECKPMGLADRPSVTVIHGKVVGPAHEVLEKLVQ